MESQPPQPTDLYPDQSTKLLEGEKQVLKCQDTFAVLDQDANVHPQDERGLFFRGTRHVSHFTLTMGGKSPPLLSAFVTRDNLLLQVDLMNPELPNLPRGTLHLRRSVLLGDGAWYELVQVTNFGDEAVTFPLRYQVGADFKDLFEVRGAKRPRRGRLHPPEVLGKVLLFGYEGLDDITRWTSIGTHHPEATFDGQGLELSWTLDPGETRTVEISLFMHATESAERPQTLPPSAHSFADLVTLARGKLEKTRAEDCAVELTDERYLSWWEQSARDLYMLSKVSDQGLFPYAGVPWFSTPFGRDSLITALCCSWAMPQMARGVLSLLAEQQADHHDAASDAEPGKILHESREGEMADLGEIPFKRYYGSIDSTPLFVMLAAEYFKQSGDRDFLHRLLPNIEAALRWIDESGDNDGDGFVEYRRKSESGLVQQGWKDSHDSVFHSNGQAAEPPIALCEVQGYVFAAKSGAAAIYEALGKTEIAERLRREASALQQKFDQAFWCAEIGSYALALDGKKQPCRVRSSNAGHCLFTGIAFKERAETLAQQLTAGDMFSGWGVRTISERESRYNPMSYHNGSVWPHDTALAAAGLARYGYRRQAEQIFDGLLALSQHVPFHRLPELLCGFPRAGDLEPTFYPVACTPQAWAAAIPYLALSSMMGLSIEGAQRVVRLHEPRLPCESVILRGLWVGPERVDVQLTRTDRGVSSEVISGAERARIEQH